MQSVPLWSSAAADDPDWSRIYDGYESAIDWPTACFFRELLREYPAAKFVLTQRDPERWADSFGATIYKLLAGRNHAPEEMRWLDMANEVITKTGFPPGLDRDRLVKAFVANNNAVKETIPAEQLLVFEDPQATLIELNKNFEPIESAGAYWAAIFSFELWKLFAAFEARDGATRK